MRSRTTREGSVGLLIVLGIATFGGIFLWLRNFQWGRTDYQIIVDFPQATGIKPGSSVLYRGVEVGKVIAINAKTNGVEAKLEISPADLRMPPDLLIEPSRYGLIGEAVVEITPQREVSEQIGEMTAISSDCDSQLIVCDQDRLQGKASGQLLSSLGRLSELYSDPEFYDNFINATKNLSVAAESIVSLSDDISGLTKTAEVELQKLAQNAEKITTDITTVSQEITELTTELTVASRRVNRLIEENSNSISSTIASIEEASDDLAKLVKDTRPIVTKIDQTLAEEDLGQLLDNVKVLTANLRDFSEQVNSDSNILTIQQTLDSARATFANAEKITADIDQLTGDPQFRNNVKKLVDGLSELISSTEQLEKQVETAIFLDVTSSQVMEVLSTAGELKSLPQPTFVKENIK